MGELVPLQSSGVLTALDPEQQEAQRAERIKEAQKLEEKLTQINQLPSRVYNVAGSCAGAGSGDFHYYRLIRRAEQDRLRRIEEEHKATTEREQFESKQKAAQAELEAKAAKKRAKRQKKKAKKKQKGADGADDSAVAGADSDADSDVQQDLD